MVKKGWNSIPWNEAEYWMAILQNSLYKSSKKKDSFHKFKIQNKIGLDPRAKLLTLRKIVDENGFFFKQNFYNKKVENDSNLQLIIFDFLKLKKLSSLQKFKLASMSSHCFFPEKKNVSEDYRNYCFSEKDLISFSPKQSLSRSSLCLLSMEEELPSGLEQGKQKGFLDTKVSNFLSENPFDVPPKGFEGDPSLRRARPTREVNSGDTKVSKFLRKIPETPAVSSHPLPCAFTDATEGSRHRFSEFSIPDTKVSEFSIPDTKVSELPRSILYWDSVFPEQGRSFNRLFLNKKFQRKELISLFERIFQVFPSKKNLQAFQFCCFLQLSNEELSTFIFEPELEPLLEPNLQPSSFFSNEMKTLVHKKKGKKSFFLLNKGFHTLLSNVSQKNVFSKGKNNVPFLFSGFLSHSFCPFLIKVFSHFITNLTLYGFIRIKGFFGKFSGWLHKNISSNKKKNYQQKILLEPFLLSGLEFDIKKWQETAKEKKNKILNPKTLSDPEGDANAKGCEYTAKVSKHSPVPLLSSREGQAAISDGIDLGNSDTLVSGIENSETIAARHRVSRISFPSIRDGNLDTRVSPLRAKGNSKNLENSSILSNSICCPLQGGKKQEFPIRDTKVSQLPKEILDFEKNQEIDKSTNWFKKTKVFSKNKFFFLLQKTQFLFFSTRIKSQISAPAPSWGPPYSPYCGPGCVQKSDVYSHPVPCASTDATPIREGSDRVSEINPFVGFSFERFFSNWFSKKIFIKSFTNSTLVKGIEFQNHVVRAYPNFFFTKNFSQKKRSSTLFLKKSSQRLVGCSFFKKRKKDVQSVKNFYKIKIFPCKNYQQRLVATLQEIISQKRGNSAKSLIFTLGSILKSWNSSLCSLINSSKIYKILRRIDSIIHLQILKWTYKCHPNWNCKKIIEKYFPKKKIYVFQGFAHKENWIFSDSFQHKKFFYKKIFLLRLSWFHRKKEEQKRKFFEKIIYSGVF